MALLTQQYGLDTSSFTVYADTGTAEFGFGTKVARDLVDFGRQGWMHELQQTVY
jgi:hypothetical protein